MDKKFCIFDMDGTLTDSMGLWQNLGRDYLISKGVAEGLLAPLLWRTVSMTMTESATMFMNELGIQGPPEQIVAEMEAVMAVHYRTDVPLKLGVAAYLARLKQNGATLCVVTATAEPLANACFARLGIAAYFDFVLSCETLGITKNSPEPFLLAARRLGAEPHEIAVFEDALHAAQTAKDAGFYTVGVYDQTAQRTWETLQAISDACIKDWRGTPVTPSQQLYKAARPIWALYHTHPFVTGIGDGSLDPEKFKFFLLQDYLYLFDYAKVFALGAVKAENPALMRRFAASVKEILEGELDLHRAYMTRLGISAEEITGVKKSLATASYTSYMLSVAFAGGTAEVVAAILACSWSYAEIGRRLAQTPGALEHPLFGAWVAGYASESYGAENRALIALMDELAGAGTPAEFARLTDIFVMCSRYEAGFWDMAWNLER